MFWLDFFYEEIGLSNLYRPTAVSLKHFALIRNLIGRKAELAREASSRNNSLVQTTLEPLTDHHHPSIQHYKLNFSSTKHFNRSFKSSLELQILSQIQITIILNIVKMTDLWYVNNSTSPLTPPIPNRFAFEMTISMSLVQLYIIMIISMIRFKY